MQIVGKYVITIELDSEKLEGHGIDIGDDVLNRICMREDINDGRIVSKQFIPAKNNDL